MPSKVQFPEIGQIREVTSTQKPLEELILIPPIPPHDGNYMATENEDPLPHYHPLTIKRHRKMRKIAKALMAMGRTVPPPDGNYIFGLSIPGLTDPD